LFLETSINHLDFAHETLGQLVLIVPLYVESSNRPKKQKLLLDFSRALTLLCPIVEQHFPFMTKDVNIQVIYIKNLLRSLSYLSVQRSCFLEIILSKLIRMDVIR